MTRKTCECCNALFLVTERFGNDHRAHFCPDEACQRYRRTQMQKRRRMAARLKQGGAPWDLGYR